MANPAYVQSWTVQTADAGADSSRTLTFNNSGTGSANPTAGNLLVAIFCGSSNAANIFPSTPSGWTAHGTNSTGVFNTVAMWTNTAVGGGSDSFLASGFTGGHQVAMLIVGVECSNATFDINTSGAPSSVTGTWPTPTGSGTSSNASCLQIIAGVIDDAVLSGLAVAGFTNIGNRGNHGNTGSTFGGTDAVYVASGLSGTNITSKNITWSGGGGTETVAGMSIVLKAPATGITYGLYPNESAYPGGMP